MARTYCIKFLIAALLVFLGAAFINLITDPYGIWETPLINGVNNSKNFGVHYRIPKYVGWSRWNSTPQTILLGTSRTAGGLRTEHHTLKNGITYNMALGGEPIYESLVLFKHSLKGGNLRSVIVGLDFFAFNAYWAMDVDEEKRLMPGSNFDLLFNSGTFQDSLATIQQSLPYMEVVRAAHASDASPIANATGTKMKISMRHLFIEVEKIFATYHRPDPYRIYSYSNTETGNNTLDSFRELLRIAYANDIEVRLFISPSHAWHWEGLSNVGLWQNWEQWKRDLTRINKEESNQAGKPNYPLWDFSGYNSITTETVPDQNISDQMEWYSDSSHYNMACGDLILERIFEQSDTSRLIPDDFGILIDDRNINAHLSNIRESRKHYTDSHVSDVQEMIDLSKQVGKH